MALQCLYAIRTGGSDFDGILDYIGRNPLDEEPVSQESLDYCRDLLRLTLPKQVWAEKIIKPKLKNWEIERVTFIDRLILELAIAEMVYMDDVPTKVSISEAIEIAKRFSTNESPSFINGILDAVYHDMLNGKLLQNGA